MNTTNDYLTLLDCFDDTPILCIGDVMLDRYVQGSVDRISPEAPIPVLRVKRETAMLGGAGNVVANLASLGALPFFTSAVGQDEAGSAIQHMTRSLGCAEPLPVDAVRPTTVKTRFVSGAQQLLRVDQEETTAIGSDGEAALIAHALAAIGNVKAVVISDYSKGLITHAVAQAVIKAARAAAIPVVVDSKPESYKFFAGATLLKPNRPELARATGLPVVTDDDIVAASIRLMELSGIDCIVATRSEQGMSVVTRGGAAIHLRTEAKEVFDVSGAGDTVAATIAVALGCGATIVQAAELANHAAGIAVAKIGTAPVRLNELRDVLRDQDDVARHKFQPLDDVADQAERWRARGVKIGFTNGCFDILHPGHISLIAQARRNCDRLIVGLNSDASVKRLKGESRPVNDEVSRAAVLSALEDVDAVVVFGEDTPKDIIERLRPDVLIKGADYTLENIVGADFVMSYGGTVVLADLQPGHSTTNTIKRMGGS
jgi:D-beta-D-heptose 7-phosphate kinase/D-beta-D-heptose 1-phosphate adenosyltransferase